MTFSRVKTVRLPGAVRCLALGTVLLATAGCNAKISSAEPEAGPPDPLAGLQPAQDMATYRAMSEQLYKLDTGLIKAEVAAAGLEKSTKPTKHKLFGFDVKQALSDADFIASAEGRALADALLTFQTPSGGWSKRTDMRTPRQPGEQFGTEKDYVPTFDNYATSTQFWVMVNACNAHKDRRYCDSASRALNFILLAQYPNGGWPQTFPLRGKYHDDITFNDDAIANLLKVVGAAAKGDERLAFMPEPLKQRAADSLQRALQMLVDTQVAVDGEPTIWGAQHDAETLKPTAARAFEPVALATSESADLMLFLMTLDNPPPAVKSAIDSAGAWFEAHKMTGLSYERGEYEYKELIANDDADPLWARFYDIDSDRPVFGDRDGEVYFDIEQVSEERRAGYGWYTERPYKALKEYKKWQQ
ncbi:pectate lyase [Microbulbifer bruguierae]|uniref:Pectate lyase n=1 Tax=Microbulbifer bruguierae TaxID=3029061 RepID=A0ABY8NF85_9GAMM|nr:pectate lyase [Microbulbifer bruguierae]WGL16158.1 pectate lyase [Microbulbifer bruguierae]